MKEKPLSSLRALLPATGAVLWFSADPYVLHVLIWVFAGMAATVVLVVAFVVVSVLLFQPPNSRLIKIIRAFMA